ncbi:MAG: NADH-quinone oxidoreductase subunit NuoF [Pseudomonadota bacterium]|nr:NADH-quinone oxidoreductase subunit NuoF [Pseudomonadota bacterium]
MTQANKVELNPKNINQVCYRTLALDNPWSLKTYESVGGYTVWREILKTKIDPQSIVAKIKDSVLRGRGGAGFSTGLKMSFIRAEAPHPRYLVCNSDEGEPGTCKDTLILQNNPHQLIEGMLIACYAQGMSCGYNYLRGEFTIQFARCEQALKEAYAEGLLGKNIQGTGIDIDLHNVLGAGSYIVGEETAMLESLEGKRGMPRVKPPFPANYGLYGKPTTINNTETLASLPVILQKGAEWFADLGCAGSGGTKIFCISGHVVKPGVYELPLGTPFRDMLALCGGVRQGRKLKAVIPGGSSMKVIPGEKMLELNMDYASLQGVGSGLGSGGVIVMDETTCMVDTLACIARFYKQESCGQCTPCREGSGWVMRIVERILDGKGRPEDIDELLRIAGNVEGRTICAFGEAFAWPVLSFVTEFQDEFSYFIEHKHSKITKEHRG